MTTTPQKVDLNIIPAAPGFYILTFHVFRVRKGPWSAHGGWGAQKSPIIGWNVTRKGYEREEITDAAPVFCNDPYIEHVTEAGGEIRMFTAMLYPDGTIDPTLGGPLQTSVEEWEAQCIRECIEDSKS